MPATTPAALDDEGSTIRTVARSAAPWLLDRLTAAEVCLDEVLSAMDAAGIENSDPVYRSILELSQAFDRILEETDGPEDRFARLSRVRDTLTLAFPHPDARQIANQ